MTSLFFQQDIAPPPAHLARDTIELLRRRFHSARHVANELTRPKSSGLCHLVCHSATCAWDRSSWHRWAATASTECVVQLGTVDDWWCSWPLANTLVCLRSCHRRTFRTHFVTVNLFSLYLMNLCFTPCMFDAAGDILRVHYKSMKRDVSFSQGNVSTIFKWGGHSSYVCKNFVLLAIVQYKMIEIFQSYDHKCTATFLWFTLPIAKLSPEMDSATPNSSKMRTFCL